MNTRNARIAPKTYAAVQLRTPLGDWQAAVVRMTALDPITTELVRLRCARYHDCKT